MKYENPEDERNLLREKWNSIRHERLSLKIRLTDKGRTVMEIRHDRDYRRLKKEQRILTKMIKHIEKKIQAGRHEK